jgi:Arc/MetJ-type ribon-helix-helix transcriptional regulator
MQTVAALWHVRFQRVQLSRFNRRGVSMLYPFPPDLRELVAARLASGNYRTEDELLGDALRALDEENEDLAAVRDAIAEWRAGDEGTPLAEAFEEVRRTVQH